MTEVITSDGATRFFYGVHTEDETGSTFTGIVVKGTDIEYDPASGLPVFGTIDRMEYHDIVNGEIIVT